MRNMMMLVLLGAAILLPLGCSAKQPQTSMTNTVEEPLWVSKGVAAFPDEIGKAFYGVGVTRKMGDPYIQRKAAIQRAREDVAGTLRTYVQSVFKDYVEAAFTDDAQGEVESLTSVVQKSIVDEVLIGSEPRDLWTAPDGSIYALVRVSSDSVAQQLRDKISEVEKDKLRISAGEAHKELDQIIEKNRQQMGK